MFALFVTAKIKPGHRAEFIEATRGDPIGSNNNDPGCLQFDVHADPRMRTRSISTKSTRIKTPGRPHTFSAPHYTKWGETVSPWFDGDPTRVELDPIFTKDKGKI
ncbi:MAG: hypothetical protein Ct9H300mP11_03650 [Chloroflexota bacterium]|nr:MAG: hypothetical protein Ct9H300mP11_03650 [Chloroflexota bacterium]